jgi:hypothetical protein
VGLGGGGEGEGGRGEGGGGEGLGGGGEGEGGGGDGDGGGGEGDGRGTGQAVWQTYFLARPHSWSFHSPDEYNSKQSSVRLYRL